jgi:hypothetical protein
VVHHDSGHLLHLCNELEYGRICRWRAEYGSRYRRNPLASCRWSGCLRLGLRHFPSGVEQWIGRVWPKAPIRCDSYLVLAFLLPHRQVSNHRPSSSTEVRAAYAYPMRHQRAKSMALVMVFHFLQGGAGSVGSTMVGGTLADIWVTSERGGKMGLFALCAVLGNSESHLREGLPSLTHSILADRFGARNNVLG